MKRKQAPSLDEQFSRYVQTMRRTRQPLPWESPFADWFARTQYGKEYTDFIGRKYRVGFTGTAGMDADMRTSLHSYTRLTRMAQERGLRVHPRARMTLALNAGDVGVTSRLWKQVLVRVKASQRAGRPVKAHVRRVRHTT